MDSTAFDRFRTPPIVIGVAGGTGSGKTTVSQQILERIRPQQIAFLQHDSYYYDNSHLPPAERAQCNYDHPESLDTPLMVEHLLSLRRGEAVDVPIYDFSTHSRTAATRTVFPAPVVLVEGILIFSEPGLRDLMDIRIFVDTDADI
ncbi:MAG: uridine kinase, partial [Chloroflexi bacterium]